MTNMEVQAFLGNGRVRVAEWPCSRLIYHITTAASGRGKAGAYQETP
jgi:hypothetical protein